MLYIFLAYFYAFLFWWVMACNNNTPFSSNWFSAHKIHTFLVEHSSSVTRFTGTGSTKTTGNFTIECLLSSIFTVHRNVFSFTMLMTCRWKPLPGSWPTADAVQPSSLVTVTK
jgi:hypothetical protein